MSDTIKVKLKAPCVKLQAEGLAISHEKNEELDWPAADARRLIERGLAEEIKAAPER